MQLVGLMHLCTAHMRASVIVERSPVGLNDYAVVLHDLLQPCHYLAAHLCINRSQSFGQSRIELFVGETGLVPGHPGFVGERVDLNAERGLMWDVHCDETDDPMSRHVETMAREVARHGLGGRAAGSHLTSMHSMDNYYVSKLLPLIAESGMTAIPNPLINITLQGRHDSYPKRRGLTRVKELQAMGITVGWGQDCVLDPWYSLGTADMLDVAFMGLHVAQMTHPAEMARCFTMVTECNAAIMGLQNYGLKVGDQASLVVLDAANPIEALRLRPDRLAVVSKGRVVAERHRNDCRLDLGSRPKSLRRRL